MAADIEISKAVAKTALSKISWESSIGPKWISTNQRQLNQRCPQCNRQVGGNWFRVTTPNIGWVCANCWNDNQTNNIDESTIINQCINELVKSTNSSRSSKAAAATKKQNNVQAKAQPYIDSGLGEPFAIAIARDENVIDSVMDLWEAKWWRQYEVDDILVCSVLDGILPEEDAKWLHTVRCDHGGFDVCLHQWVLHSRMGSSASIVGSIRTHKRLHPYSAEPSPMSSLASTRRR